MAFISRSQEASLISGHVKKAAKRSRAPGSALWPTEKWKPVASIPVKAFDAPPLRLPTVRTLLSAAAAAGDARRPEPGGRAARRI